MTVGIMGAKRPTKAKGFRNNAPRSPKCHRVWHEGLTLAPSESRSSRPEFIAVFNALVRSHKQVQSLAAQKVLEHVDAEGHGNAAKQVRLEGPKKVAKQAIAWDVGWPL